MWPWLLASGVGLGAAAVAFGIHRMRRAGNDETSRALALFRHRRELLEAKFFDLAGSRGKPRGLRWRHCEWKEDVRFARDLETGLITAFVAVEIHFEAVEGGDMEDVEAVGHFREGSAVFHYQAGAWGTGGKALFNMSPEEAVRRLEGQYEALPRQIPPDR